MSLYLWLSKPNMKKTASILGVWERFLLSSWAQTHQCRCSVFRHLNVVTELEICRLWELSDHVAPMFLPPLAGKFSKYWLNWMWAKILPFRYLFLTHELVERTNNRNSYSSSVNTSIRPTTFFVVSLIHRFTFSSVFICSQQCKFIKPSHSSWQQQKFEPLLSKRIQV